MRGCAFVSQLEGAISLPCHNEMKKKARSRCHPTPHLIGIIAVGCSRRCQKKQTSHPFLYRRIAPVESVNGSCPKIAINYSYTN